MWLDPDDTGELGGVVQRARTGEKRRFARLVDLPALIARMVGHGSTMRKEGTR